MKRQKKVRGVVTNGDHGGGIESVREERDDLSAVEERSVAEETERGGQRERKDDAEDLFRDSSHLLYVSAFTAMKNFHYLH